MGEKSAYLVRETREAREALSMSQRALSERTGQTQSHISQIESGKMEPGLSSFIDMARALGLEVMLVPKKLVPGVRAIVASHTNAIPQTRADQPRDKSFDRADRLLKKMQNAFGTSVDFKRVEDALHLLQRVPLIDRDKHLVQSQIDLLERHQASPDVSAILSDVAQRLQRLRNRIAHGGNAGPKPAYTLDDEDDDA